MYFLLQNCQNTLILQGILKKRISVEFNRGSHMVIKKASPKIVKKPLKKALKTKIKAKTKTEVTKTLKPIAQKQTKSQIIEKIMEEASLSRKQVLAVFEALRKQVMGHMKKKGSGEFTIPAIGLRIKRKTRPASKKRMGRNPAMGEQIMIAAKPARTVVKAVILRTLKESVNG